MQLLSSRGQSASTSRSHESFMQHQYYHISANKDYGDEYRTKNFQQICLQLPGELCY